MRLGRCHVPRLDKKCLWLLACLSFLIISASGKSAQPAPANQDTIGAPWRGSHGVTETIDQLMSREKKNPTRRQVLPRALEREFEIDRSHLPQDPNSPVVANSFATGRTQLGAAVQVANAFAPQVVGTSFLGGQINDTIGFVPPDSMADVGSSQIVVCVNGLIRTFTKSGMADGVLSMSTSNFFLSVMGSSDVSDPRVRYDRLSGRWFISMITVDTPNRIVFAVSSGPQITSSPASRSFFFQQNMSHPRIDNNRFADYQRSGWTRTRCILGSTYSPVAGTSFQEHTGFVVNKAGLTNGTLTVTAFRQSD